MRIKNKNFALEISRSLRARARLIQNENQVEDKKIFLGILFTLKFYIENDKLRPNALTLLLFELLRIIQFFPSMIFCGEAAKKTSIDGLKWRDLVMGRWWLVNFDVSAVRCPVSQRVSCVKLRKAAVAM